MEANVFWDIISQYNQNTWIFQVLLFCLFILSFVLAYTKKLYHYPKLALGILNVYIAIVFFLYYGTEPIQIYFALPLYMVIGILFFYEAFKRKNDLFQKPDTVQILLLFLVLFYPFVSLLLGNSFPAMVTYIMPCPVISLSIVIYSCYKYKNKYLLLLMAIWGLTGIKAFFFNALEDIILLICGIYCLFLFIKELQTTKIS